MLPGCGLIQQDPCAGTGRGGGRDSHQRDGPAKAGLSHSDRERDLRGRPKAGGGEGDSVWHVKAGHLSVSLSVHAATSSQWPGLHVHEEPAPWPPRLIGGRLLP